MSKVVTISDSTLTNNVLPKADIVAQFPFLRLAADTARQLTGCASCQKTTLGALLTQRLREARSHIARMPQADKQAFKAALGATRVRVYYFDEVNGVAIRRHQDF